MTDLANLEKLRLVQNKLKSKNETKKEITYIEKCIDLSWWELLRPFYIRKDPFIKRLSYFTYSHRVVNGKINSSRIAYGSVINPDIVYDFAKEIIILYLEDWDGILKKGILKHIFVLKTLKIFPQIIKNF